MAWSVGKCCSALQLAPNGHHLDMWTCRLLYKAPRPNPLWAEKPACHIAAASSWNAASTANVQGLQVPLNQCCCDATCRAGQVLLTNTPVVHEQAPQPRLPPPHLHRCCVCTCQPKAQVPGWRVHEPAMNQRRTCLLLWAAQALTGPVKMSGPAAPQQPTIQTQQTPAAPAAPSRVTGRGRAKM